MPEHNPTAPGDEPLWRRGLWVVLLAVALAPAVYRLAIPGGPRADRPGQIVIRYMAWGNPQQLEVERAVIRRFNARPAASGPDVRVDLIMPPAGGYAQKLRLMLASGTAPDVIRVDHYEFPSLVPKGYFRDLTDLAAGDPDFDARDFHAAAMHENYYRGQLYGLNTMFGGLVCYYNQDLFARAGLDDPYELWKQGRWTWEAFDDAARRLTQRDAAGRITCYGYLMPGGPNGPTPNMWALWAWRYGGEMLSPDHRRCLVDLPETMRGLQSMHDLLHKFQAAPTPADAAASAFTFESGNVAMMFEYTGMTPRFRDNIRDFAWDIAPTPAPTGRPYAMVKGNQLVISAASPHPREAWAWIRFLTSRETELQLYGDELRRAVPTRKSVLDGADYRRAARPPFHTDVLPYTLDHARHLPIDATWPAWTQVMSKFTASFFLDPHAKAEEVIPTAARAVNLELTRERERMKRYLEDQGER